MTYVREHPDQTVLVHLTRAACAPTVLPVAALGAEVRGCTVVHGAAPDVDGGHWVLSGDGPAASVMVVEGSSC
jgi:alpha-glucosidase